MYYFLNFNESSSKTKLFQVDFIVVYKDDIEPDESNISQFKYFLDAYKKSLKQKIDNKIQNKIRDILNEYDYTSLDELSIYAANKDSIWHNEAIAIIKWVEENYKNMYSFIGAIVDENTIKYDYNFELTKLVIVEENSESTESESTESESTESESTESDNNV